MQVSEFKSELYNHVFGILDSEDLHSSPCGVGGDRAAEIATKIAELAERLLMDTGDPQKWVAVLVNKRTGRAERITAEDTEKRVRNFAIACDTYNPWFTWVTRPAGVKVGDRIFKEPV